VLCSATAPSYKQRMLLHSLKQLHTFPQLWLEYGLMLPKSKNFKIKLQILHKNYISGHSNVGNVWKLEISLSNSMSYLYMIIWFYGSTLALT